MYYVLFIIYIIYNLLFMIYYSIIQLFIRSLIHLSLLLIICNIHYLFIIIYSLFHN